MPNLRGASPVGRDGGGGSNAARTGSSGSPRRRCRDPKENLGPVKMRVGQGKMWDELVSLQVTRERSVILAVPVGTRGECVSQDSVRRNPAVRTTSTDRILSGGGGGGGLRRRRQRRLGRLTTGMLRDRNKKRRRSRWRARRRHNGVWRRRQ